jgi:glycerol-3-phosphate acyltransferase PlsX
MPAARIALDAFGGDNCPGVEIEGAVQAARGGVHVVLVGQRDKIEAELRRYPDVGRLPISIHHASQVITMDDKPGKAVRAKPDASMPVCFDLVQRGEADAAMSAGNSGAMLACGLFKYRRIKGVDRPAIVASLPTQGEFVTVLDVGANIDCRPLHFAQFAVLGAVYARFKHGRQSPRLGLLSNGTEEQKGTDLIRSVHHILAEHPTDEFSYCGYVEGDGVLRGEVDVVVTDGFTGNIALKVAEATGRLVGVWLRRAIAADTWSKLGAVFMKRAFAELKSQLNPDTYGAAPLLGVNGLAFICHGGSSPFAIATALRSATRSVHESFVPQVTEAVARHAELFAACRSLDAEAQPATNEKGVTA